MELSSDSVYDHKSVVPGQFSWINISSFVDSVLQIKQRVGKLAVDLLYEFTLQQTS